MAVKQLIPQKLRNKEKIQIWDIRNSILKEYLNNKLMVSTSKYTHIISLSKISFIRASSNYSIINMIDGSTILTCKTLKLYEEKLINKGFLRVHSGYLVNLEYIEGIAKNGIWTLLLKDNTKIPISRKYKKMLTR